MLVQVTTLGWHASSTDAFNNAAVVDAVVGDAGTGNYLRMACKFY